MRIGRMIGLMLLILGVIASAFLLYQVSHQGAIYRIMIAGPPLATMGLAMVLLPGVDLSVHDFNATPGNQWWSDTPIAVRLVWIGAGAVGLVYAFSLVF